MFFMKEIAFTLDSFIKIVMLDHLGGKCFLQNCKELLIHFFKNKRKGNSVWRFIDYNIVKKNFVP